MKIYLNNSPKLMVLSQQTPMQSGLSDHNLLISEGILFYNMMMQCRWNDSKKRFNNGFGAIESDSDYQSRIKLTVRILAELVAINPHIYAIALAEAPIKKDDIIQFIKEASLYPSLHRFAASLHENVFTSMGVATFFDSQRFQIKPIEIEEKKMPRSLINRFQLYLLTSKENGNESIFSNMHLPFDIAKSSDNDELIESLKQLIHFDKKIPVTIVGDFNSHPKVIIKKLNNFSAVIRKNNNFLLKTDQNAHVVDVQFDTVDGILQTHHNNQHPSHFDISNLSFFGANPIKEYRIVKKIIASSLVFFKQSFQNKIKASTHSIENDVMSFSF